MNRPQGDDPARPARRRWPSRRALLVGVAGLALVGGGITAAVVLPSDDAGDSTRAMRAPVEPYFAALARGDAAAALRTASLAPDDTTYLTDEVLATQRATAKLTNVHIGQVRRIDAEDATVTVSYTMGATPVQAVLPVDKGADGQWGVTNPTVRVNLGPSLVAVPQLTFFGRRLPPKTISVEIFPGPFEIGTSDPYVTVSFHGGETYKGDENAAFVPGRESVPAAQADLTRAARTQVLASIAARLTRCAASHDLAPAGCPQRVYDAHAVRGTAVWGVPSTDALAKDLRIAGQTDQVDVTGELRWPVSYQLRTPDGGTSRKHETVPVGVYGGVDLTRAPLRFTPRLER